MTGEVVVSGALTIEGLHGAHSQLVAADKKRHFLVDSKTSTLALKWLNLTSGAPDEHGGSIKITKGARLNVSHCIFYKNTATSSTQSTSGGAIFAQGAIVSVDHTSFEKNHAEYMGGGVFINDFGSINLEASMFALNTANSGGGGIYLKLGSTGNLRNSTFYRNEAKSRGGAIYVWGDTENAVALNLSRVRLVENKQTSTVLDKDLGGGGLGLKGNVNVDIRECTFLRNEAGSGSLNEKHGHQIMTHNIAEGAVGYVGTLNVVVVNTLFKNILPDHHFYGYIYYGYRPDEPNEEAGLEYYIKPIGCDLNPCTVLPFTGSCSPRADTDYGVLCGVNEEVVCRAGEVGIVLENSLPPDSIGCSPYSVCPPGTFVSKNGTAFSDRNCSACSRGTYSEAENRKECKHWTLCAPGQFVAINGTPTLDQDCGDCENSTFSEAPNSPTCSKWVDCDPGQIVISNGTLKKDRACGHCPNGTFTATKNSRACTPQRNCTAGTFLPANATRESYDPCTICANGKFQPSDRQVMCLPCPAGSVTATVLPRVASDHDGLDDCLPSRLLLGVAPVGVLIGGTNVSVSIPADMANVFSKYRNLTRLFLGDLPLDSSGVKISDDQKTIEHIRIPKNGVCGIRQGGGAFCETWTKITAVDTVYNARGTVDVFYLERPCPTSEKCTTIPPRFELYPSNDCKFRGSTGACEECPRGARCPGGEQVWALPEFGGTLEQGLKKFNLCKPPSLRCRGYIEREKKEVCGPAYDGALCGGCKSGYYANLVGDQTCRTCPYTDGSSAFVSLVLTMLYIMGIFAAVGAFAFVASYAAFKRRGGTVKGGLNRTKEFLIYLWLALCLLAQVSRKSNGNLPSYFQGLAQSLAIFQFDIAGPLPPGCTTEPFWRHFLVFSMSIVFTVCTSIFFGPERLRKAVCTGRRGIFEKLAHVMTTYLCICYAVSINLALETVHCVSVSIPTSADAPPSEGGNVVVMANNPLSPCFEGAHTTAYVFAVLTLAMHGILFPAISAWKITSVRRWHLKRAKPDRRSFGSHVMIERAEHFPFYDDFVWKYFLANSFLPQHFYFQHVILVTFLFAALCNEFLYAYSPLAYILVYAFVLGSAAALYVRQKPFLHDQRWKLPVRVVLLLCAFCNALLNYFASPMVVRQGPGAANHLSWLAPISFIMNLLLFVILLVAYGRVLLEGASGEEKEKKKPVLKHVESIINWASNPIANKSIIEMKRRQRPSETSEKVPARKVEEDQPSLDTTIARKVAHRNSWHAEEEEEAPPQDTAPNVAHGPRNSWCAEEGGDGEGGDGEAEEEAFVSETWCQHYDLSSNELYYECKTTKTMWDVPENGYDDAEILVHEADGEGSYYEVRERRTTWTKPEGVHIHVISSAPTKVVAKLKKALSRVMSKKELKPRSAEPCSLSEARRQLKNVKSTSGVTSPPKSVKARGQWWEVIGEDGRTCYLNTVTDKVLYQLPKGWVLSLARTRFSGGNSTKK
jgi:hypothetical protein